jgi:hypothetical protein
MHWSSNWWRADKTGSKPNLEDPDTLRYLKDEGRVAAGCALKNWPNATSLYVASDTAAAVRLLRPGVPVVSNGRGNDRHFDGGLWASPEPGYGIFMDLWVLAHAACVSYGVGGFGRFASVLAGRHCWARYRNYTNLRPCDMPTAVKS